MTWAFKRKLFYLTSFFSLIFLFGFLVFSPMINKAPTCFDGKQNGEETGLDCGGNCMLACTKQVDEISVLWARSFKVVPGRYNAIAYLQNLNENKVINKINYRFRFADKDNVYIGKREGQTFVPPSGKFAVFAPAIDVGNSIPVFTSFEFTEDPIWINVKPELVSQLKILVSDIKLENEETNPAMSATLTNSSLFRIPEVSAVSILYDESGNAVSVSHTYLDVLKAEEKARINFTWREPFTEKVVAKEIIPMFDFFSAKLK
jgi:hypothetical protein